MLPPADLDGLSHADLKSLVLKLLEEVAELRRTVAAQRDEIARLKGGPGRPNIKPSGMDKATEPRPPPPTGSEPRQKGGKTSKLSIHEERTVTIAAPPQGSRFKGYTNFVVQDLVIRSHVVNFRRERWQKPDGDMMTAPLPAGISGHFGPELRRFVLAQYHQGQVTVPRLLAQLRAFGIVISKRQLVRLLIAGQDGFLAENREVLRAGLCGQVWRNAMPRKGWPLAPAFGGCGLDRAWRSAEVCHQEIDGEVWPRCNFKPLVFSQFRTAVDSMDKATEPRPPPPTGSEPRQKGGKTSKLSIHEERTVTVAAPPQGSRFKGYTNFVVQDLVIRSYVVNFRRERWQKPDGDMMTAPLPAGISGHFGPELRRFVLAQYHQGQMTVPRLLAQLRAFGIVISKRQLVRLLIAGQDGFLAENREVLRAGLSSAAWVTVDDTGARHKAANGFCTQIGNAHFVWFGTTASKSRLNFLHLLRAGHSDYVINTEALDYMRQRALSSPVIARLAEHPQRFFTSQVAWTAHLDRLGISALEVNPDPVMVATEGALWGSVKSHGFLPDTVIVSDDAGQFNVGPHGLCWVHAERLVHKLDTFTDEQRKAQRRTRALIWRFYRDLKTYRQHPTPQCKAALRARFDRIFTRKTGFVTLDCALRSIPISRSD